MVVRDSGIGIPRDELDNLFTRFFRASNTARHAISGTGLGLTIVRTVAERHGGTVTIDSEENVGTTVTIRLPLSDDVSPAAT
ncbi:ATP-binding protein [Luedemannella flava]